MVAKTGDNSQVVQLLFLPAHEGDDCMSVLSMGCARMVLLL